MELKVHDQEIFLQKLWKSRKLFSKELRTSSGKKVEVLYSGRENFDAGPDFKDAVVKIDGTILKGDVEVHLDAAGWYAHGHQNDPAYNTVILHLISEQVKKEQFIEREDSVKIEQIVVYLDQFNQKQNKRKGREGSTRQIVENCPLSQRDDEKIRATINVAGEQRLNEKVEQLREDSLRYSWDQLIYKKILEALGYSKNQIPFRRLADLVPYETVCAEMQWVSEEIALKKCAALLFGSAGLLPSQQKNGAAITDAETLNYVAPLEVFWEQISHRLAIQPMKYHEWQFFRLRPQNFPTRRIAGFAQLMQKYYRHGFLTGFLKVFSGHLKDADKISREIEKSLTVKTTGFWSGHYHFTDEHLSRSESTLIGKDRARDIVVNIVFPVLFLYGCESNDGMLKNSIRELFGRHPKLTENSITKTMTKQLFRGSPQKSKILTSAFQQQGLIHLQKLFCKTLKCADCLQLTEAKP